jgi:putative transposase
MSLLRLSLCDVELILAARDTVVSHETIREEGLRCGRLFANASERSRPRPGDNWFLDAVFVRIQGKLRYLWRAVDQDGPVLDILVQSQGCQPVLPQAADGFAMGAASDRHGQAA